MFPGMNPFCAAIILSRTSPEEFLELTPSEREQAFGPLIGYNRIVSSVTLFLQPYLCHRI